MRLLVMFCYTIMHLMSCSQENDNPFIEKIINDYSRNSYYILINIELSGIVYPYLVENDDLFYYYHQRKGFKEKQYQEYIRPIINKGRTLTINGNDIKKYGFTSVSSINKLSNDIKKGKAFFLKKYFENRVLKDGLSIEDRNNIIAALFKWKVASRIDDESGYLIYSE